MVLLIYHIVREKKHETKPKFFFIYFFFARILLFFAIACLWEREYLPKIPKIILLALFTLAHSVFVFGATQERKEIASFTVYKPFCSEKVNLCSLSVKITMDSTEIVKGHFTASRSSVRTEARSFAKSKGFLI